MVSNRYVLLSFFFRVYIFSFVVVQAGAGGGLVASIATCPLDVIKTKLQAQSAVQGQKAYLNAYGVLHVFLFSILNLKIQLSQFHFGFL